MSLRLEVLTPMGSVLEQDVESVTVPGVQGELGVLTAHLPLISKIQPGVLRFAGTNDDSGFVAVANGFVEVSADGKVVVLTDNSAFAADVDKDALKTERDDALAELASWSAAVDELDEESGSWQENPEYSALRNRIDWAQARLDLSLHS